MCLEGELADLRIALRSGQRHGETAATLLVSMRKYFMYPSDKSADDELERLVALVWMVVTGVRERDVPLAQQPAAELLATLEAYWRSRGLFR